MKVKINNLELNVDRAAYVTAKTKQLREFGYALTEQHVSDQLDMLLAGKKLGTGLTVIGSFMEDEVILSGKSK